MGFSVGLSVGSSVGASVAFSVGLSVGSSGSVLHAVSVIPSTSASTISIANKRFITKFLSEKILLTTKATI